MPKVVDHSAYREELLAGCFDLFARLGYAGVTMRGIAKELGVSTGTLYHYFDTKDAIFEAMVQHVAQTDILAAVATIPPQADADTRLRALFAYIEAFETRLRNVVLLVLDYRRQTGGQGAAQAIHAYREAIRTHMGAQEPHVATLVFSAVVGVLVQRILADDAVDMREIANALLAAQSPLPEAIDAVS